MGNIESNLNQCCGPRPLPKLDGAPAAPLQAQPGYTPGYTQAVGALEAATVGGPPPAPTGRRRALLVGCNYPGSQAELNGCVNDVLRMSSLLRRVYGFSPHDMRILTDDGHGPHGYSTRANITSGFRWLVEDVKPGDALFFHYSGHGGQQEDPNYAEEDGYDETILPTDFQNAGQIVDDEIFDSICARLPSGAKLTAVMDCCHSGTGLDLPFIWQNGQWVEEDNPCHSAGDVLLISGCLDEQTSADATGHRGEAAGALTTALADTIEEQGDTPQGVAQLLQATHAKLQQRGFDQIPNLTASQRFDVVRRQFSVTQGFESNMNPMLGRHFRKAKHPKMDFGGGFNDLLSNAGMGMMLAPMVGSMFAGHQSPPEVQPTAVAPPGGAYDSGGGWDTAQPAPLASFGSATDGQGFGGFGGGFAEGSSEDDGGLNAWGGGGGGDDDDGDWD